MKAIVDLLANIESPVPEKTLVTYMLNGLSPKFKNISMLIRHKDPLRTFLEARSTLVSKEFRVNMNHTLSLSHYDHGSLPTVPLANNTIFDNRRPQNQRSPSNWRTSDSFDNHLSQSSSSDGRFPPVKPWSPNFYPWVAYRWHAPPSWVVPCLPPPPPESSTLIAFPPATI